VGLRQHVQHRLSRQGHGTVADSSAAACAGSRPDRLPVHPPRRGASPIYVPPPLVILFLYLKLAGNSLLFRKTYEQPWMLAYADRLLRVDAQVTRQKLDWNPKDEYRILNRLPLLMANFRNCRRTWLARNIRRSEGNYQYDPRP
jgi:hypothetical protein